MAVIAVTSGTPGAGKTTVAINLAAALGRLQRRVVLFDATPGPSTVAHRLGLSQSSLPATGPYGVQVVTQHLGRARRKLTSNEMTELATLIHALDAETDYVVVDTPTSPNALTRIASYADDVLVVTDVQTPDTRRVVGAIRRLAAGRRPASTGIVVNGVAAYEEGERVGRKLEVACERLDGHVQLCGVVTADPDLARAQMMQRAVVDCRPQSSSSRCFQTLARQVVRTGPSGGGGLSRFAGLGSDTVSTLAQMEARQCA